MKIILLAMVLLSVLVYDGSIEREVYLRFMWVSFSLGALQLVFNFIIMMTRKEQDDGY